MARAGAGPFPRFMSTDSPQTALPEALGARFDAAWRFSEFLAEAQSNAILWRDQYRLAKVPDEAVARAAALPGHWRLLVIVEDWCGDAVNTVPILARLAELVPTLELRVLPRDRNLDVMDAHLTDGKRSIPKVLVLDEAGAVRGSWGPRPTELQDWFLAEGVRLEKDLRYRHVRTWYARDRGRTTVDEVLAIVERAADADR